MLLVFRYMYSIISNRSTSCSTSIFQFNPNSSGPLQLTLTINPIILKLFSAPIRLPISHSEQLPHQRYQLPPVSLSLSAGHQQRRNLHSINLWNLLSSLHQCRCGNCLTNSLLSREINQAINYLIRIIISDLELHWQPLTRGDQPPPVPVICHLTMIYGNDLRLPQSLINALYSTCAPLHWTMRTGLAKR